MARKKNEVARVVIGPTVLPATKAALKRLAIDGLTAGEVIDLAVAQYERAGGVKTPAELAFDAARVMEWMREARRAPAAQAFTAGDERQVAYCFEEVLEALGEDSEFRPSPYLKSLAPRMGAKLGVDDMEAMDTIGGWFEDVFERREVPEIKRVLEGSTLAEARAATSSEEASTPVSPTRLQAVAPGEVRCQCRHCPRSFSAARFGILCPACAEAGHAGDPKDCAECAKGLSL